MLLLMTRGPLNECSYRKALPSLLNYWYDIHSILRHVVNK